MYLYTGSIYTLYILYAKFVGVLYSKYIHIHTRTYIYIYREYDNNLCQTFSNKKKLLFMAQINHYILIHTYIYIFI